jgi:rubrerythrin
MEKQLRAEAAAKSVSQVPATVATPSVQVPKETGLLVTKKLWYCRQCGYVCYREDPPYICPICKAKREMFTEVQT